MKEKLVKMMSLLADQTGESQIPWDMGIEGRVYGTMMVGYCVFIIKFGNSYLTQVDEGNKTVISVSYDPGSPGHKEAQALFEAARRSHCESEKIVDSILACLENFADE